MTDWRLDRKRLPDLRLAPGLLLPVLAGLTLFGWRAGGVMLLVILGAMATQMLLNRTPSMPNRLSRLSLIMHSALLSLFLPATLFDLDRTLIAPAARWPLPIALGAVLALTTWLTQRAGTARAHPVVGTLLLAIVLTPALLRTDRVLTRQHVLAGDVLDDRVAPRPTSTAEPWLVSSAPGAVVYRLPQAWKRIDDFLAARVPPDRPALTIARLLSDDLPPLEDLVVAGHPRRIGQASAIAIVIGGLFLVHRRVVAFRVPALMLITTFAVLFVAPVPVVVSTEEISRRWCASLDPRVGWAAGLTLVNYMLLASPTLLATFFLASLPGVRPLGGRAVMRYSILFGVACGALTALVSVENGALIAVALVQLIAPSLERRR